MKKNQYMNILYFTAFAALILYLACYSLGLFGGDIIRKAVNKEYTENGFTFTGSLKNEKFDGDGEISYQDGGNYSGSFLNGRFDGNGIYTSPDGWRIEGLFEAGGIRNGTFYRQDGVTVTFEWGEKSEIVTSSAGWKHEGEFGEAGQMGPGGFTFSNGAVYGGDFFAGLANGNGTYKAADGKVIYEGDFKAGRFEGQGIYYSPDGWQYEGGFKNGVFNGDGTLTKDNKSNKGVWKEGRQVKREAQ